MKSVVRCNSRTIFFELNAMKINLFIITVGLFIVVLTLVSCKTVTTVETRPEEEYLNRFFGNLQALDEGAVFLSASTRKTDRGEEYDQCLIHGAEQAARYVGVEAEGVLMMEKQGGRIGYFDSFSVDVDQAMVESLLEDLEVLDFYQDDRGSYMLSVLPDQPGPDLGGRVGQNGREPSWVSTPPRFEGYYTGVGVVQRSRKVPDSLDRADLAALGDILSQISVKVQTGSLTGTGRLGTSSRTRSRIEVGGRIEGFLVISRWIHDGFYYSLGVCPEQGQEVR